MKYPHIFTKVFCEPWIITKQHHAAIADALLQRANAELVPEKAGLLEDLGFDTSDPKIEWADGIAIVPVAGIIGKGLSKLEMACGGCDLHAVSAMLDEAVERGAETIVLNFDTPGGTVTGVPEFGRKLAAIGESGIRTVAYTENLMASAGYWLAAQCTDIVASPSSRVGSIGVIMGYYEYSAALEAQGIKQELFQAGALKSAGDPGKPATNEERAYFQGRVEKSMAQFQAAVSHRYLSDETMQGQVFDGDEAQSLGLIDFTADSLEELLATIMSVG